MPPHHRFRNLVSQSDLSLLPRPQPPQIRPGAFMLCPPALVPNAPLAGAFWMHLYQLAFAEAQAVVRPSLPERDLLGSWN